MATENTLKNDRGEAVNNPPCESIRPNVLHLQHFIYPYRLPAFDLLAERLDFEVYFCRRKRSFREWAAEIPSDAAYGGRVFRAIRLGPFTLNPELIRVLRHRYDVYSVATLDFTTLFQFIMILAVAKIRRRPFIMVDEFLVTEYYKKRRKLSYIANKILRKLIYRHVDAFVLWNKLGGEFLKENGVSNQKIFYGPQVLVGDYDGLQSRAAKEKSEKQNTDHRFINVLYVGSLIERKGVDVLIRAFQGLKHTEARLTIVGKGDAGEALRDLSRDDSRIIFRGHLEGKEKREAFATADVFVLPSLHEPWGFVVNEALEFGLPVITTSAVGAAAYMVKENGYIVPPGDVCSLRDAIRSLIEKEGQLEIFSKASNRLALRWGVKDMVAPFLEAVDYVCTSR